MLTRITTQDEIMLIYIVSTLKKNPNNKHKPAKPKANKHPKFKQMKRKNQRQTHFLFTKEIQEKTTPAGDFSAYRYLTRSTHTAELPHNPTITLQPFLRSLPNQNTAIPTGPCEAAKPYQLRNLQKNQAFRIFSDLPFLLKISQERTQRNGTMLFKYISEVFFTFC